ncbi:phosphoribosylformylglycinamidine synthase subunit PurQ [Rhodovulum sp. DZ06]|uniref:phosphoribosylformylglycinamidine synthase subunit PurQ n=1 Tax=Rhodovulum sp. DZ06 TaxID=3425126 RepID=UPI003D34BF39
MKTAVLIFPGSNCDRDMATALERAAGRAPALVWHKETELPKGLDLVAIPGGFSFGDHLRCGAIAARMPIMRAVVDFVHGGGHALGVCNGFQVLCETGLLPGVLMRNSGLRFLCKDVALKVETADSPFTRGYKPGGEITIPIAHHDGNYRADAETLAALKDQDRVAFTYAGGAPNGAADDIAGILSENRRVLGMMPHPERAVDALHGGTDGAAMFAALAESLADA